MFPVLPPISRGKVKRRVKGLAKYSVKLLCFVRSLQVRHLCTWLFGRVLVLVDPTVTRIFCNFPFPSTITLPPWCVPRVQNEYYCAALNPCLGMTYIPAPLYYYQPTTSPHQLPAQDSETWGVRRRFTP